MLQTVSTASSDAGHTVQTKVKFSTSWPSRVRVRVRWVVRGVLKRLRSNVSPLKSVRSVSGESWVDWRAGEIRLDTPRRNRVPHR